MFATMPSYSQADGVLATKLLTFFPQNTKIASHNAVIMTFDVENGLPKALIDGDVVTAMRTAAASAVATKYLAPEGSETLAIIGCGIQARSHFQALSRVCSFKNVRVWNWKKEKAETFGAEIGATVCSTVEEAVKNADVIVTVTSSPTPVLKKEWVKPGAHINAVGACRPDWAEIYPDLMCSSVLYVDTYEGARKESGDIVMSKAEIYGEIGEMVLGLKEARRKETTIFKSLGFGLLDAVAANLVIQKCQAGNKQ